MRTHSTKDGAITIHHNSTWTGDAVIVGQHGERREFGVEAAKLLTGDYDPPPDCKVTERELRRATALAMYLYVTQQSVAAVENIDAAGVL